jgi:hypothetical protein
MKIFIKSLPVSLAITFRVFAQDPGDNVTIFIDYGAEFDLDAGYVFTFADQTKAGFESSNNGFLGYGYFDDGFDVSAEAGALNLNNMSSFFSSFNLLAQSDFTNATSPGLIKPSATLAYPYQDGSDVDNASGKTGYLMLLKGTTTWAGNASVTEIGLFRDTSFDLIPKGTVSGETHDVRPDVTGDAGTTLRYDTIVLGNEFLTVPGTGSFAGMNLNIYATQAVSAVPEPSTYAMMLGAAAFGFVFYKRRIKGKKQQLDSETQGAV